MRHGFSFTSQLRSQSMDELARLRVQQRMGLSHSASTPMLRQPPPARRRQQQPPPPPLVKVRHSMSSLDSPVSPLGAFTSFGLHFEPEFPYVLEIYREEPHGRDSFTLWAHVLARCPGCEHYFHDPGDADEHDCPWQRRRRVADLRRSVRRSMEDLRS